MSSCKSLKYLFRAVFENLIIFQWADLTLLRLIQELQNRVATKQKLLIIFS